MLRAVKLFHSPYSQLNHIRCHSTTIIATPLSKILENTNKFFGEIPKIRSKIISLQAIIPDESVKDYLDFNPKTITIGIVQSPSIRSGLFLDVLISDPLSSDNSFVSAIEQYRNHNSNANIQVFYGDEFEHLRGGKFSIKSPVLNKDLRLIQNATMGDNTKNLLSRNLFNDLSFVEINDHKFKQTIHVEGVEQLDFNTKATDSEIKKEVCQLFIYVTSSKSETEKLNDYPNLTVINTILNNDLPTGKFNLEKEKGDVVVDLAKIEFANTKIQESVSNISEYLKMIRESRTSELLFTLNKETSGYNPTILLLNGLLRDIKNDVKIIGKESIMRDSGKLNEEILEWAQGSHFELQSKITPFVESVLLGKYTKITQLIWNSEDLSIVLANYLLDSRFEIKTTLFGENIKCHGTLVDSNAKLYYLEGKIDAIFPGEATSSAISLQNELLNPMLDVKSKLVDEKLPELQNRLNKLLITEAIQVPLPVFAITTLGYIFDLIDLNTAGAFFAFSLALSTYKAQKNVFKLINDFKDWYLESLRVSIDENLIYLKEKLSKNINKYGNNLDKKLQNINEIKSTIKKLEEAENVLEGRKIEETKTIKKV